MSSIDMSSSWEEYKLEFAAAALVNNPDVEVLLERSFLPRRCYLSGKKLWWQHSVKLIRKVRSNYPHGSVILKERYWIDSREYMMLVLRNSK